MIFRVILEPALEPLTLGEAKEHLRVDHSAEDARIGSLIKAARQQMENERGIALITQTLEVGWSGFPCGGVIVIPHPPLQTLTSITYVDSAGATQTWAASSYVLVNSSGPKARRARVTPIYGGVYPSTQYQDEAITVRFVAGFGLTSASVPEPLRQALLLHIGEMYEDRETRIVGAAVVQRPTYDRLVQSCVEIAA